MATLPRKIAAFFAASQKPVVYFAHPMSTYGSKLEKRIVRKLRAMGYDVFNPGAGWVQKEVNAYRKAHPDSYMQLFKMICDACQTCVVLPFPADLEMGDDTPQPEAKHRKFTADDDVDDIDVDDLVGTRPPLQHQPQPLPPLLGAGVCYEMDTFFARPAPVLVVTLAADGTIGLQQVTNFDGFRQLNVAETRYALKHYRPE